MLKNIGLLLGFLCLEFAFIETGQPNYFFELSHISLGAFFEVIVLAFLLSKRFEWEKQAIVQAKLIAQKQLLQNTVENEKIIREQNILLEKRVSERTSELTEANKELNLLLDAVEIERQKSDKLLLNILPASTALELKEKGYAQPKVYESVTVLFSDFKNFTATTEHVSPEVLVSSLDWYFSKFDKIVSKYRLEKIKTIGDSYMAVGGLPIRNENHAQDTVKAALEMINLNKECQKKSFSSDQLFWDIRIGLNSGPVVAGVVGLHKFSYDIWGNTVNTAARMEEHTPIGKVNISLSTFNLVKNDYNCVSRGKIVVKGKGAIDMFEVV